jgi:hypothetical protein
MNLALPTLNIMSLIVLLLYMFISVYIRELHDACVGMVIVVLGVSGVKTGRRRRFWVLWRG